jgi:hypothetical protein
VNRHSPPGSGLAQAVVAIADTNLLCSALTVTASEIDPRLHRIATARPYPLLFATISGAHVLPLGAAGTRQSRTCIAT